MKQALEQRLVFGERPRRFKPRSKAAKGVPPGDLFRSVGHAPAGAAVLSPSAGESFRGVDPAKLTHEERRVAELIEAHTRANPISLRELVARVGLSERVVQQIIEDLIVLHGMRIGASRELPRPGYYLCLDEADIEAAVRPLRSSAASLLKRIEALTRPQDG